MQVQRLCDRNAGVGADGLMLLEPAQGNEAHWSWQFYNSDGSRAEMCGNGARCFAAFARGLKPCESLSFETDAGLIRAEFSDHRVCVDLTSPGPMTLNQPLDKLEAPILVHSINTGVPHAVVVVDDLDEVNVAKLGAQVRYHEAFSPKGTNVNFVQPLDSNQIRVRTTNAVWKARPWLVERAFQLAHWSWHNCMTCVRPYGSKLKVVRIWRFPFNAMERVLTNFV